MTKLSSRRHQILTEVRHTAVVTAPRSRAPEVVVTCGASGEAARLGEAMATGVVAAPGRRRCGDATAARIAGERSAELEVVIAQMRRGRYEVFVAGTRVEVDTSVVPTR
jgi:hypothetical protein